MKNTFRVLLAMVLSVLSSCSRDERFYGKWKFDRDFTLSQLTNRAQTGTSVTPPGLPDWVSPHPLLVIGQLDGVTYTINANALTMSAKGEVHTNSYEVLRRLNPNEIVVKTDKGDTNNFRLMGDRMEIDANLGFRLYFSRATK